MSHMIFWNRLDQCSDDWWKTISHDYVLKPNPAANGESQPLPGLDCCVDANSSDEEDMIDLQGSPSLLHESSDEEMC